MGVLTEYYSFLKAGWKEYVDVEKHINNNFDLADNLFHAQSEELKKKEPIINKKSGFNLDITDRKDLNDSNKVVSAKALMEVNDAKADKDLVYQKPLDSIYGSITARNGRLYTSGVFNNIHGLENASVLEYGSNKIITTPDNSFSTIIEDDKIYLNSVSNIATVSTGSFANGEIVNDGIVIKSLTSNKITKLLRLVDYTAIKANTYYFIKYEIVSGIENFSNISCYYINFEKPYYLVAPKGQFIAKTKPEIEGNFFIMLYMNDDAPLNSEVKIRITISEGNEEKPIVPPQYNLKGNLSFDSINGRTIENTSFIGKQCVSDIALPNNGAIISMDGNRIGVTESSTTDFFASKLSKKNCVIFGTAYSGDLNFHYGGYSPIKISQLYIYNSVLSDSELETELSKNLCIEGKLDVISQIKNSMRVGAVLGKRPKGNIQDNTGATTVGEIWYDEANEKYYECKTATDENFINLTKWEERSIKSAYDRGSLGIFNASAAQIKADSAYTLASGKKNNFTENNGFNRVMVDIPEDSGNKVLSAKGGKYLENRIDNLDFAASLTKNGYQKLPSGLIVQWGSVPFGTVSGVEIVTLPIAFPNAILNVNGSPLETYDIGIDSVSVAASKNGSSLSTISVSVDRGSTTTGVGCSWLAIGY